MKGTTKVIAILSVLLTVFGLTACKDKLPPADTEEAFAAYAEFEEKLGFTASLEEYSLIKRTTADGATAETTLTLAKTAAGEYAAVRTADGGEEYYHRGVRYFTENGVKKKRAVTLAQFLEIGEYSSLPDGENVRLRRALDGGVSFELVTADFDFCLVTAYFSDIFIESISVTVSYILDGETVNKTIEYVYVNPGEKPEITLPEDPENYSWL